MNKVPKYVAGLGVAALVAVAVVIVVSSRGNDGAEPARKPPVARQSSRTAPVVSWVAEANTVCRLGRKLYPNLALGAAGETDTISYAIRTLVSEITAIATSPPSSGRRALELHGQAAVEAWNALATSPDATVTSSDKQEAARSANRYVNQLVALGAAACAPLRPRTA